MHELSICQALVDEVARIARNHRARRATMVRVAVGPLSGVEPELLERAFPFAAAGTPVEGAMLVVCRVPLRVHCRACDHESDAAANSLRCARCGAVDVRVTSGEDLTLDRVEFEVDAAPAQPAAGPWPHGTKVASTGP